MMASNLERFEHFGPEWTRRPVMVFAGQLDTHIKTGEDYDTRTLGSLFTMDPDDKPKGGGLAFIPSSYNDFDGREHKAQRERGEFVTLTGDIDKGDHSLERVETLVRGFAGESAWLIYSSAHAHPGDMRWRVILPLEEPLNFAEWHDAQLAFFAFMEAAGIEMDGALGRAAQPVYLPNVPRQHAKTKEDLRDDTGAPLHYRRSSTGTNAPGIALDAGAMAAGLAVILRQREVDDRERERIRVEAARKRANRPQTDNAALIDDFGQHNSVTQLLELYGYERSPRHSEDWRSPHQTGESYATRVIGDKWVSLSQSDAAASLGDRFDAGCYGDAYDLFVHYEHGGDHKAAFRQLHAERKAASGGAVQTRERPALPVEGGEDWDFDPETGDPILSELGDYADDDLEPVPLVPALPSLPFFWFRDAEPNLDANDFVEGLLTTTAMSVIYGPSNCGKTFFVVDLALHVAWGREWRGREVDRGAVVYLSLEGAQGIRNRLSAFRKHHEIGEEELPFVAMPKPVNLLNEDADVNAVIALVQHVAAETGLPVVMVIIDTLSRAMAGGNENSPEDMTAFVGNCDRIRDATGAHVCVVHHSGKDEAKGARGHSSLRAATDTEIEIKRDPELTISSVRIAKQRDLEAGDPFAFSLHKMALGTNRRGKDVTSCVVVDADQTVIISRNPNKLSDKESLALDCLSRCILTAGFETVTARNGESVTAVTQHHWRGALAALEIIDRNNNETARVQFHRIRKALENKGRIGWSEDGVWIA